MDHFRTKHLLNSKFLFCFYLILFSLQVTQAAEPIPRSVKEIAASFDPRQDDLDTKVVREWDKDGISYRYVTYHIGTFKGKAARMAAFYAFPKGAENLPALLHVHGGGQRAFLHEVEFYAKRGYACLSINWGGREMEKAKPGDSNTDWGNVNPTQHNVPGYFNLKPGDKYIDPVESPRNNNWYLLTLGSRRGLTFLERQVEVDPNRLGVYGHSMGGNLTIFVAGTDDRVKVAAPSVGGSGYRTQPWPLLPEQRKQTPHGDVDLFNATIGYESYAPLISAPTLWLGATNDFHGIMDDTFRTGELIPHENVRYSFAPHLNHRFTAEFAITRPLWIDQHLKRNFKFPQTPESKLLLSTESSVPVFEVTPDSSMPVEHVHILYSIDPDPQARFWRTAQATQDGDTWLAELPVMSNELPLFVFANVHYGLENPDAVPYSETTQTFAISSLLHTVSPQELEQAAVKITDEPSLLIDDFSQGWQDWYLLSANNSHHWEFSTRKLNDPKWRGQAGYQLAFQVRSDQPNELVVILMENFFRSYRSRSREYVALVKLAGGEESVVLEPEDFKASDGTALGSWKNIDLLSWRAYHDKSGKVIGTKSWAGDQPVFRHLRWISPEK